MLPVLRYRSTTENQGDNVAAEVAGHKAQNGPSGVFERFVGPEEAKVHK